MAQSLWSAIVVASNGNQLENLLQTVDGLSTEEKATLIKHVLGDPGLSVVFGNNQLSGSIIVQINTIDRSALGDLLEAIAERVRTEQ